MTEAHKLAIKHRLEVLFKDIEKIRETDPMLASVLTCRLYNVFQKALNSKKRAYTIVKVLDKEKGLVEVIE